MVVSHTILLVRSENVAWRALREIMLRERRAAPRLLPDVSTAAAALRAVAESHPEIVLTRTPLPDMALSAFVGALKQSHPEVCIVAIVDDSNRLTGSELTTLVAGGLAGALCWSDILAPSTDHWLRAVLAGIEVYSPPLLTAALSAFRSPYALGSERPILSERERQVLMLLIDGASTDEIAMRLGIGTGTVSIYLHRLREKFQVRSTSQLCYLAGRPGFELSGSLVVGTLRWRLDMRTDNPGVGTYCRHGNPARRADHWIGADHPTK